ncbi:hypothetical protein SAMN04487939_105140 [Lysobacter sp. yr284]|nr:hypothetical protein SAMN04487939_105140 [Lysobacter sp. yr284]
MDRFRSPRGGRGRINVDRIDAPIRRWRRRELDPNPRALRFVGASAVGAVRVLCRLSARPDPSGSQFGRYAGFGRDADIDLPAQLADPGEAQHVPIREFHRPIAGELPRLKRLHDEDAVQCGLRPALTALALKRPTQQVFEGCGVRGSGRRRLCGRPGCHRAAGSKTRDGRGQREDASQTHRRKTGAHKSHEIQALPFPVQFHASTDRGGPKRGGRRMQAVLTGPRAPFRAAPAHPLSNASSTAIRAATPLATWVRISDCGPSATSSVISTPRFIGPGCITTASGAARLSRAAVRP